MGVREGALTLYPMLPAAPRAAFPTPLNVRPLVGSLRRPLDNRRSTRKYHNYITSHIAVIKAYGKAIPKAWRRIARIFVALGDPHRQRIVLMFEPGERLNIGQIVAASTLSRTAVTHHLRVLREAGVLRSEKIGREVYFWPDADTVRQALEAVKEYVRGH